MGLFHLTNLFGMTIRESANDGSDFTNPDADYRRLFLGEDGLFHLKDSAGTVTTPAFANPMTTAGDVIYGGASGVATRLAIGTAGQVLTVNAGATAPEWAAASGGSYVSGELDYVAFTSDVNITATTEGGANTIVTANAEAFDGSTDIYVEFWAWRATPVAASGAILDFVLFDDTGGGAASIGIFGMVRNPAAGSMSVPVSLRRKLTPSNATHTYSVRAFLGAAGTGIVHAGAGGSGDEMPGFIRLVRA